MADTMKVKFEFTLDDVVDGVERNAVRSATVGRLRVGQTIMASTSAFLFSFLVIPGTNARKLAWAFAMALLAAIIQRFQSSGTRKRRMKQLFQERFGPNGPYVCEVEVGPSGLITNQMGTQMQRKWSAIQSVEDTGNAIEFVMQGFGNVVVRNRAFKSKDEWREFLDLSLRYLNIARGKVEGAMDQQPSHGRSP